MVQLVYFDNSVVRALVDNPEKWDVFYDKSIEIFGEDIRPVYSYYLFFEYIGFKKSNLTKPREEMLKFDNIGNNYIRALKENSKIGLALEDYFKKAHSSLYDQLSSVEIKNRIINLIQIRVADHESSFNGSQDLKKILFKEILDLLYHDYPTFAQRAALHLAWDYFCNISGSGISTDLLRRAQLDIWVQLWEKHALFPFGKIIDDFFTFQDRNPSDNTRFKGSGDMVDAEGLTYAITGLVHKNGNIEMVNFVTCDPIINVKERVEFALYRIFKFDEDKRRLTNIKPGKVYCLKKDSLELEEKFPVQRP